MANVLRITRRAVGGASGAPSSLANAQLAFSEPDDILYYGKGTGGAGGSATSVEPIAGKGAFVTLATAQTVTGAKSFTAAVTVPTVAAGDSSTNASTTAWVRGYAQPADTDLDGVAALITTGIAARTGTGTWATRAITGTAGRLAVANGDGVAGNPTLDLAALAIGGSGIGAFTKLTVDTYGRVTSTAQASVTDLGVPTADVSWNSFKITNLADPVGAQDAATRAFVLAQVEAARQGLDTKASVRVAASTDIVITGPGGTIDGVTMAVGDRVALMGQTTASQNGIYIFNGATVAMTRAADADSDADVTPGMYFFVEQGTANGDKGFVLTTNAPITLGTTALAFTQFNGAGGASYTFANGVAESAGTVSLAGQARALHDLAADGVIARTGAGTVAARAITGTAARIAVANGSGVAGAPTIDIDAAYVGQASITTLGTIGTGAWQGSAVGLGFGGTGATTAAAARTNLGLGSMAEQAASAVAISGGSIANLATFDGITIDGGTF